MEAQKLGKGKRLRKQVNYASEMLQADSAAIAAAADQENDDSFSEGSAALSDSASLNDEFEGVREEKRRKKSERTDEKLPPLLVRINGIVEVLGFNPRQRRTFYNTTMRYGM